ncbi:hypothetical protein K7432_007883 [Basidiobolus ranarum]|uniref:Uncharacterized protein n=1 Tax=Basidiobolus ranarum TaxID=34480 RepID=A0ABR2VZH0_9FUNG
MPFVETVGGLLGVAVVSSMVARKVHFKKQQDKVNALAKELWTRRRFIYGSPEVVNSATSFRSSTSHQSGQASTHVNYYPSSSATVTPDIAPPAYLYHDDIHPTYSSSMPVISLPPISSWETDAYRPSGFTSSLSRESAENIELAVLSLPSPPSCILRQEIPSAPIFDGTNAIMRDCLEAPMLTSSRQEPSAPILNEIESNGFSNGFIPLIDSNNEPTSEHTNSVDISLCPTNVWDAHEEFSESENRSSEESFYSCSSTLLDYSIHEG